MNIVAHSITSSISETASLFFNLAAVELCPGGRVTITDQLTIEKIITASQSNNPVRVRCPTCRTIFDIDVKPFEIPKED